MAQFADNKFKILPRSFWASRKIDDKNAAAYSGNGPAEHSSFGDGHACVPHGFGYSRRRTMRDSSGGFRHTVPRGEAGSAGCKDQVGKVLIANPFQLIFKLGLIVREQGVTGDGIPGRAGNLTDNRAAEVFPLSSETFIAGS